MRVPEHCLTTPLVPSHTKFSVPCHDGVVNVFLSYSGGRVDGKFCLHSD
jgi:hypothetical protein